MTQSGRLDVGPVTLGHGVEGMGWGELGAICQMLPIREVTKQALPSCLQIETEPAVVGGHAGSEEP